MIPPAVVVLMGVSGSGKTTVGKALAERLHWPFREGDDFHPASNIAKMASGEPLTDADRGPWLAAIGAWIDTRAGRPVVVSCSALKRSYRRYLTAGRPAVRLVWLKVPPAVVADRLSRRSGHFMPPSLMESQFADLEAPGPGEDVIAIDSDRPVEAQVESIVVRLSGPD
jgi:gluconokinase